MSLKIVLSSRAKSANRSFVFAQLYCTSLKFSPYHVLTIASVCNEYIKIKYLCAVKIFAALLLLTFWPEKKRMVRSRFGYCLVSALYLIRFISEVQCPRHFLIGSHDKVEAVARWHFPFPKVFIEFPLDILRSLLFFEIKVDEALDISRYHLWSSENGAE